MWRVNLSADGLSLNQEPYSLLLRPLATSDDFICCCREDAHEIVVAHGPGLNVVRVNVDVQTPQDPIDSFNVLGSELTHFYDGFLSQGYFIKNFNF